LKVVTINFLQLFITIKLNIYERFLMRFLSIVLFFTLLNSSIFAIEPIKPIPLNIEYHTKKAKLGKKLFFDFRLSKDNTISCATCHILEEGGDDNLSVSFGIDGQSGHINSPTVLNSYFNFRQFWNGRAKTLQDQVFFPIENPIEMGNSLKDILYFLKNDPYYNKEFQAIYKEGITKKISPMQLQSLKKHLLLLMPLLINI